MSKLNNVIIVGKECEDCKFSTFDENNKAKVMIYCGIKDKWYIYGKCIICDDKIKKVKDD